MIAKTYASNILNTLLGASGSTLSAPSKVYIGLCAHEPDNDKNPGSLADAGEPASVKSYSRVEVSGTNASKKFFSGASKGVIVNSDDIQFKSARQNYPETMHYWFLSTGDLSRTEDGNVTNQPNAFLWGKIKDVLFDKQEVEGFAAVSGQTGVYCASVKNDISLDLADDTDYVVYWDGTVDEKENGVEFEVKSTTYTNGDTSYIKLGDFNNTPFEILYNESTDGSEVAYNVNIYYRSDTAISKCKVAIYGVDGIEVKKATVPTFYAGELQASIDA